MARINERLDAEAAKWWKRRHQPAIREQLVIHYGDFAKKIAKGMWRAIQHSALGWEEIDAAASLGLMQAIDRYQPGTHAAFTSFATWRIRGECIQAAREHDWVPHGAREKEKHGRLTIPLLLPLCGHDKNEIEEYEVVPDLLALDLPEGHKRAIRNILDCGLHSAADIEGVSIGLLVAVLGGELRAVLNEQCHLSSC